MLTIPQRHELWACEEFEISARPLPSHAADMRVMPSLMRRGLAARTLTTIEPRLEGYVATPAGLAALEQEQ